MRFSDVLKSSPIPECLKVKLFGVLSSFFHPALRDPVVFMIMVMIVIFKDPSNDQARMNSDQYWTMLHRWIKRKVKEQKELPLENKAFADEEAILQMLGRCSEILPYMMKMEPELL